MVKIMEMGLAFLLTGLMQSFINDYAYYLIN